MSETGIWELKELHIDPSIHSLCKSNALPQQFMSDHPRGVITLTELGVVPSVLGTLKSNALSLNHCPRLTHLSLRNLQLTHDDVSNLSISKEEGNLPKLTFLDLSGSDVKGKMAELFKTEWPELTHLYLKGCVLEETDLKVLSNSDKRISNLKSIALTLGDEAEIALLIPSPIVHVTDVWLDCMRHQYNNLVDSLNNEQHTRLEVLQIYMRDSPPENVIIMPSLSRVTYQKQAIMRPLNVATVTYLTLHRSIRSTQHLHIVTTREFLTKLNTLDISHSSGITGGLSMLLCHSFPLLETLILSDCGLHAEDLKSLAKASTRGRLPGVKHLDVSYNIFKSSADLESLFTDGCKWESLLNLNVRTSSDHWFPVLNEKVRKGCFSSLQELRFSVLGRLSAGCSVQWSSLKNICISYVQISKGSMVNAVITSVEKGMFPSLELLTLSGSTSGSYSPDIDDSSQPISQTIVDMDSQYDYADHYVVFQFVS